MTTSTPGPAASLNADQIAKADAVIDRIFETFRRQGHLEYGESVTQYMHAVQAAVCAERDGRDAAMISACLLHDYGHLVHGHGEDIAEHGVDGRHEDHTAHALRDKFSDAVVEPARLHVAAKRYLCTVDEGYYKSLSPASELSLRLQGGKMNDQEKAAFEAEPFFQQAVQLRHYDDQGKDPNMKTPPLEHFRQYLRVCVKV